MKVEKDYEDLLKLFNKYKVQYCIIGAFAVAFYAKPRYTKDIDILVSSDIKNGERIIAALYEFGFRNIELKAEDFTAGNQIIQLGYEPVRIDILTYIAGCSFAEIWQSRKSGLYGKEKVYFIGLNQLIKNKEAAHRKQDMADLDLLKKAQQRLKNKK